MEDATKRIVVLQYQRNHLERKHSAYEKRLKVEGMSSIIWENPGYYGYLATPIKYVCALDTPENRKLFPQYEANLKKYWAKGDELDEMEQHKAWLMKELAGRISRKAHSKV